MKDLINLVHEKDNLIIISDYSLQQDILAYISKHNWFKNISFKTFQEVAEDFYGHYSLEGLFKLSTEQELIPEIANTLLLNSLLVEDVIDNNKISNLLGIKKTYHNYLEYYPEAKDYYKNRDVVIVERDYRNLLFNKALNELMAITNVLFYNFKAESNNKKTIYSFRSLKDEVYGLVHEVSKLLHKGVKAENIKITYPSKDYYLIMTEVFRLYNIDIVFEENNSLLDYPLTKEFLNILYSYYNLDFKLSVSKVLEEINQEYNVREEINSLIINNIINVLNELVFFDGQTKDIIPLFEYLLKNKQVNFNNYVNVIKAGNFIKSTITDNDYCFLLGLNQNILPKIYKDEDYLLDFEKELLDLPTSSDLNKQEKNTLKNFINRSKDIYISFSESSFEGKIYPSSFISENNFDVTNYVFDDKVSYSLLKDKLEYAKALDEYFKYDNLTDRLGQLKYNLSDISYKSYDNNFTYIDPVLLENKFTDGLSLSYTTLDLFYNCHFRYYLERVLYLDKPQEQRAILIGNFFHYVLESFYNNYLDQDLTDFVAENAESFIEKNSLILSKKDKFYFKKFEKNLIDILEVLLYQQQRTNFKVTGVEQAFEVLIDHNKKAYLRGKIDLVLKHDNYCVVIDFKTGSNDFNYGYLYYGLDMQTMIYFYLLNQSGTTRHNFAGAYLQSLIPNSPFSYDEKFTYKEQYFNYLKLNGYSIQDFDIITHINYSYNDNGYIRGINQKRNGDFYSTSLKRTLTLTDFNMLLDYTDLMVKDAVTLIYNGDFKINPKKDNKVNSCRYCVFNDICFKRETNYVDIIVDENYLLIEERLKKVKTNDSN